MTLLISLKLFSCCLSNMILIKWFFYVKKTFLVFICAKLDILNQVLGKKDVEKGAFCASLSFVRFLRGALSANDLATHIPKDRFIKMFSDSKHVLEKRYFSKSSQNFVFFVWFDSEQLEISDWVKKARNRASIFWIYEQILDMYCLMVKRVSSEIVVVIFSRNHVFLLLLGICQWDFELQGSRTFENFRKRRPRAIYEKLFFFRYHFCVSQNEAWKSKIATLSSTSLPHCR